MATVIPLHLRTVMSADFAAATVGPEGSICLLLVEEPDVCVVMRPQGAGDKVVRQYVEAGGRGLCPETPPPAHRVAWAETELPAIARYIVDHNRRAGVSLLVWFGDRIGEHQSVWLATTMTPNDNVIFFREYLGARPS